MVIDFLLYLGSRDVTYSILTLLCNGKQLQISHHGCNMLAMKV